MNILFALPGHLLPSTFPSMIVLINLLLCTRWPNILPQPKSTWLKLNFLLRGSSKVEEAVDCYLRAANLFKMAKKWAQAGQAFCLAAQLHLKAGVRHDAATNFVDASNCYKKCDPNGKY